MRATGSAHQPFQSELITGAAPSLPDSIGVNSRASTTSERANRGAFLTTCNTANKRTRPRSACGGQLIAMFLPKTAPMTMAIAYAT